LTAEPGTGGSAATGSSGSASKAASGSTNTMSAYSGLDGSRDASVPSSESASCSTPSGWPEHALAAAVFVSRAGRGTVAAGLAACRSSRWPSHQAPPGVCCLHASVPLLRPTGCGSRTYTHATRCPCYPLSPSYYCHLYYVTPSLFQSSPRPSHIRPRRQERRPHANQPQPGALRAAGGAGTSAGLRGSEPVRGGLWRGPRH